jgi:hypothetical protein
MAEKFEKAYPAPVQLSAYGDLVQEHGCFMHSVVVLDTLARLRHCSLKCSTCRYRLLGSVVLTKDSSKDTQKCASSSKMMQMKISKNISTMFSAFVQHSVCFSLQSSNGAPYDVLFASPTYLHMPKITPNKQSVLDRNKKTNNRR